MDQIVSILDRGTLAAAEDLIGRFGESAALEAALRAGRSREVGNVIHFCRWREVERLCDLLAARAPPGTIH